MLKNYQSTKKLSTQIVSGIFFYFGETQNKLVTPPFLLVINSYWVSFYVQNVCGKKEILSQNGTSKQPWSKSSGGWTTPDTTVASEFVSTLYDNTSFGSTTLDVRYLNVGYMYINVSEGSVLMVYLVRSVLYCLLFFFFFCVCVNLLILLCICRKK